MADAILCARCGGEGRILVNRSRPVDDAGNIVPLYESTRIENYSEWATCPECHGFGRVNPQAEIG